MIMTSTPILSLDAATGHGVNGVNGGTYGGSGANSVNGFQGPSLPSSRQTQTSITRLQFVLPVAPPVAAKRSQSPEGFVTGPGGAGGGGGDTNASGNGGVNAGRQRAAAGNIKDRRTSLSAGGSGIIGASVQGAPNGALSSRLTPSTSSTRHHTRTSSSHSHSSSTPRPHYIPHIPPPSPSTVLTPPLISPSSQHSGNSNGGNSSRGGTSYFPTDAAGPDRDGFALPPPVPVSGSSPVTHPAQLSIPTQHSITSDTTALSDLPQRASLPDPSPTSPTSATFHPPQYPTTPRSAPYALRDRDPFDSSLHPMTGWSTTSASESVFDSPKSSSAAGGGRMTEGSIYNSGDFDRSGERNGAMGGVHGGPGDHAGGGNIMGSYRLTSSAGSMYPSTTSAHAIHSKHPSHSTHQSSVPSYTPYPPGASHTAAALTKHAHRAAQNRVAQRAYRERKANYLRGLEDRAREAREWMERVERAEMESERWKEVVRRVVEENEILRRGGCAVAVSNTPSSGSDADKSPSQRPYGGYFADPGGFDQQGVHGHFGHVMSERDERERSERQKRAGRESESASERDGDDGVDADGESGSGSGSGGTEEDGGMSESPREMDVGRSRAASGSGSGNESGESSGSGGSRGSGNGDSSGSGSGGDTTAVEDVEMGDAADVVPGGKFEKMVGVVGGDRPSGDGRAGVVDRLWLKTILS
ncbi:hypothetical protein HDU93_000813 [Gonapodya sp. JEL0774]|nr:hypothetical protein HDU93_000813 [Gonapodya sp. JEL0774]